MRRLIISAMLIAIGLGILPRFVFAVAAAPAIIELSGQRGQVLSSSLFVINTQDEDRTYYLKSLKFIPNGETGEPQFIPWDTDHAGLPEWIQFSATAVRVPAHEKVQIPFSAHIPSDIPSGGYYGAILVSASPAPVVATNNASIEANVAVLLFLTVEGETNRSGALLDFRSDLGGFFDTVRTSYVYRIQNQGNVHVQPTGTVTLFDVFGRTIVSASANAGGGRILPGTTRTFTGSIGASGSLSFFETVRDQVQHFALGPIRAELRLNDMGSEPLIASFRFWVIPWQLLVTLLVVVGVVIGIPRVFARRK